MEIVILPLPQEKWYFNPCIPYNVGFAYSRYDNIIIQNPECFHHGNILDYTNEHLNDTNYLAFACYSLTKDKDPFSWDMSMALPQGIDKLGDDCWYNHSIHRPSAYHFCAAIRRNNLTEIGGFSHEFANGSGYDDDDLVEKVKLHNLNIKIVDSEVALHQWHYSAETNPRHNRYDINRRVYLEKWGSYGS